LLGGCLDFGSKSVGGDSQTSDVKQSSSATSGIINLNPRITIDGSVYLKKYPNLSSLTLEVPGISGIHISGDELKTNSNLVVNSPGSGVVINVRDVLNNGQVVQEVIK